MARYALLLSALVVLAFVPFYAHAEVYAHAPAAHALASRVDQRTDGTASQPYLLHVPQPSSRPAPVLVALHGIGDRGGAFAASMIERARVEGWVLVAPTFQYGDWRNPNAVADEDVRLVQELRDLILGLPLETGVRTESKVMLYGFSRGAQVAHRFTLVNPELVRSAVVLAAGTYTLPRETFQSGDGVKQLAWPYGCADFVARFGHRLNRERLRGVPFLIGVGEQDNNPGDLPRQWDQYVGSTRVERARSFARSLADQGVPTRFMVFPRHGHAAGGVARSTALDFLGRVLALEDDLNPTYDRPVRSQQG